jgi:hypothetical protein
VYRTGWEERNVWRWRPRTYRQLWLFAVLALGVPVFIISAALPMQASWLSGAFFSGASAAFFGGLLETWRLYRRRRKARRVLTEMVKALAFPPAAGDAADPMP